MIAAAKEGGEGCKEFGFLDANFVEQTNVSCSFLPIEVKNS